MKTLRNFFDSNDEKLTDKAFSHGIIISVLSILLCIVALCSATYAWFVEEQESSNNVLVSGSFDLDAFVTCTTAPELNIEIIDSMCTLNTAGTYTIKLVISAESTVKGYCGITINNGEKEITVPIYPVSQTGIHELTFTIVKSTDSDTVIKFVPEWGYPANHTIENGEIINID